MDWMEMEWVQSGLVGAKRALVGRWMILLDKIEFPALCSLCLNSICFKSAEC